MTNTITIRPAPTGNAQGTYPSGSPAVYTVALVATNTAGSNTKTKTAYVTVA